MVKSNKNLIKNIWSKLTKLDNYLYRNTLPSLPLVMNNLVENLGTRC